MKHAFTILLLIVACTLHGQIKLGEMQAGRVTSPFIKGTVSVFAWPGLTVTHDPKDETMFTITATSEGPTGITIKLTNKAGLRVTKTIPITVVAGPVEDNEIKIKLPYHG